MKSFWVLQAQLNRTGEVEDLGCRIRNRIPNAGRGSVLGSRCYLFRLSILASAASPRSILAHPGCGEIVRCANGTTVGLQKLVTNDRKDSFTCTP